MEQKPAPKSALKRNERQWSQQGRIESRPNEGNDFRDARNELLFLPQLHLGIVKLGEFSFPSHRGADVEVQEVVVAGVEEAGRSLNRPKERKEQHHHNGAGGKGRLRLSRLRA